MKLVRWLIVAAAIAFVPPAHALDRAGQGTAPLPAMGAADPVMLIYRTAGVRDNGGAAGFGIATSFHCTNLSEVAETLVIIVRDFDGALVSNLSFILTSARTWTASTHATLVFDQDAALSPGTLINQGYAAIGSTSTAITCSAMIVDAAAASPIGISLHMLRYNPAPGTQE